MIQSPSLSFITPVHPSESTEHSKDPAPINDNVASLMERFTLAWNESTGFDFPENSFNLEHFTDLLINHTAKFKKEDVDYKTHCGYIEKFDLDPSENPQIYMRADLHGDLKSLIENLRSLQNEGLLDANFKCKPGVHLIFLGDYCDRGSYGAEILELLMRLCEENPQQVHLIRGNHEYQHTNFLYGADDRNLMDIIGNTKSRDALEHFYETMSLTTYFSVTKGDQKEYVQCTHGLFDPTMDPAPLLDHLNSGAHLPVPKKRELSDRILKIADSSSELREAAEKIKELVKSKYYEESNSAYNWGDVSNFGVSDLRSYNGRPTLSVEDIRHYLDLSSEQHRVMMIFRGHQHKFMHHKLGDEVLITTLPTGMDCPAFKFDQSDRAYIIQPDILVKDWKKRAILREKGHAQTDEITPPVPLTSSEV